MEIIALVAAAVVAGVVAGTQTGVSEGVVEWFRRRRQRAALPGPEGAPTAPESASPEPDPGPEDGTGSAPAGPDAATPDGGTTYHTQISDCHYVSVSGTQINHHGRSRRER
ncbi:hypothetical protein ACKI1O_04755 [Streptomyces scabiei]